MCKMSEKKAVKKRMLGYNNNNTKNAVKKTHIRDLFHLKWNSFAVSLFVLVFVLFFSNKRKVCITIAAYSAQLSKQPLDNRVDSSQCVTFRHCVLIEPCTQCGYVYCHNELSN